MAIKIPAAMMKIGETLWHAPGRALKAMNRAASVAMWAQIGAGLAATLLLYWYGNAILKGPWPQDQMGKVIDRLGEGQAWAAVIMLVSLAAIAGLRLGMKATKGGFDLSAERDDPQDHQTRIETVIDEPKDAAPTVDTTVTRDGVKIPEATPAPDPKPEGQDPNK